MTAFADSDDMIARYDERTLKDLVSDTGTQVSDLSADAKMTAALSDATGAIKAALRVGRQYKVSDLEGLTDESLSLLKRITCELALYYIYSRRPGKYADQMQAQKEATDQYITALSRGERIFEVSGNLDASLLSTTSPTSVQVRDQNYITTRTKHYYASEAQRLPRGRG